MITDSKTLVALVVATIVNILLILYLTKVKRKNQLSKAFICALMLLGLWLVGLIMQITLSKPFNIEPIYFDYFVYIGACFVPITVLFIGLVFANTKI